MFDKSHLGNGNYHDPICVNEIPKLKVGFVEQKDLLDFKVAGKFSAYNDHGVAILKGVSSPLKWRLKVENRKQVQYSYNILIGKFTRKEAAAENGYQLLEKGIGVRIKTYGGKLFHNGKEINDNTEYWLIVDQLPSKTEAQEFAKKMLAGISYSIISEKINEPHAILELFDNEFEKLGESGNTLKIVPDSKESVIYVYEFKGHHFPGKPVRNKLVFEGPVEFRCMDNGRIAIINEMEINEYVEGILAQYAHENYPNELLKSLAVSIRSKTLANLCIDHFNDPFDLCSTSHCLPFSGRIEVSKNVSKAVRETRGVVMKQKNRIISAETSYVCGGLIETVNSNEKHLKNSNSLFPIFDGDNGENLKDYDDLTANENLKKWVTEPPNAYCNSKFILDFDFPGHLRNYFRWKVSYERNELEHFISQYAGRKIGSLFEILPSLRNHSGRIQEVEILASDTNLTITGEREICKSLSEKGLPSTCFYVEPQLDADGFPLSFTFYGAGFGNGAGLCQAGAYNMALKGASYDEILKHYFRNINIKKIYED